MKINPSVLTTCKIFAAAGILGLVSGCSYISGLFPDKQKQYRYSTEIPALEIPPDLTSSTIDGAKQSRRSEFAGRSGTMDSGDTPPSESVSAATSASTGDNDADKSAAEPVSETPRSNKDKAPATLAENTEDVPLVEIDESFERAWNAVAKALGRMELEVSDQNRSEGTFFVYYGAGKDYKDRGFFNDLAGIFGGGRDEAEEFHIKLEERARATSVYVLDKENKPQSEGKGLELLKSLHETLQHLSEPPRDSSKS